ncbi:MAG: type II secretion system F family protein [Candidatus Pacearchaeota archaeon]
MQEITQIKANLDKAKNLLQELNSVALAYEKAKVNERAILEKTSKALVDQLSMIYEPLPAIAQVIEFNNHAKKAAPEKAKVERKIERISTAGGPVYVTSGYKSRFLEELNLSEKELKEAKAKILKRKVTPSEEMAVIMKPSALAVFASRIFGPMSANLTKAALFKSVERDLRKANMPYMLSTYISIIFFFTFLALFVSVIIALAVSAAMQVTITTFIRNIAIALFLTCITFFFVLSYPSSVAGGIRKKLETELPFAAAHMAAIASSKVEPTKIFTIMAMTKEYKAFSLEIRKVVNQINVYGYDLTTALRNAIKTSPSKRYSDLLNGMVTTITTGGDLTTYLHEKSKSLLIDYRLSHERYTNVIGMYSDIYTALLIAAPLIFMLLLAIISIMGTSFLSMDISTLANLGIALIAMLNLLFLILLHFTQPEV